MPQSNPSVDAGASLRRQPDLGATGLSRPSKHAPDKRTTLSPTKGLLFLVLGLLPALLIAANADPILTLAERLRQYDPERDFAGVLERFRAAAGADLSRIAALERARQLLLSTGTDVSEFARIGSADRENGLFAYLEAGKRARSGTNRDPASRFGAVESLIETARSAPRCDWYTARTAQAWRNAYAPIDIGKDVKALWARDAACRDEARTIRRVSGALCELAGQLLREGRTDDSLACLAGVDDFCTRTLNDVVSSEVAVACAEQIEREQRLLAVVHAARSDWNDADRAHARADRADRFARILRQRREFATQDPILQVPVLREQPYRAAFAYLLSSGFLFTGWLTLLAVALAAACVAGALRLFGGPNDSATARVGCEWMHWFWSAAIVAGPAAGLATAVQFVPPKLNLVSSQNWVQSGIVLSVILTLAAVLTLARARTLAGGASAPNRSRVWSVWWVLVGLLAILVFFRPWVPLGANLENFDRGLRSPLAPSRAHLYQSLVLLAGILATVVWLVWLMLGRFRRRGSGGALRQEGGGTSLAGCTAVLALWGWLILGIMCAGSFRLYHRYDARLSGLVVQDLEDEVGAWMGPAWKRAFFDEEVNGRASAEQSN